MSKEVKIGILAIVCIAGLFWGYRFLKGKNILSRSNTFYAVFEKVEDLPVSSPVLISGLQVGTVQEQYLKDGNPHRIVVVLDIQYKIKLPKNATVVMQSTSLMGGKSIRIDFDEACHSNCAVSGDTLASRHEGILSTLLPTETLNSYLAIIKNNLGGIIDSLDNKLGKEGSPTAEMINDVKKVIHNLSEITSNLNYIVKGMSGDLLRTSKDLKTLSSTLAADSKKISSIIHNVDQLSSQLANSDLETTLNDAGIAVKKLDQTLVSFNKTAEQLELTMAKLNNGDGSLGLLINDKSLYHNLDRSTKQLDLLLQDVRLNPKRYVNVSVFGKKQKEYDLPETDPANKILRDTTSLKD
jgi:phospholipid/cholesterol/gamma-HCH transport system substrate-binding protein